MGFGRDLRQMRLQAGFKLRPFAKKVGISATYLSKIEREEFLPPSAEILINMAKLLNINPDVTCLRAGRVPPWIKDIMISDQAIFCIDAFYKIKSGSYEYEIFQKIGKYQ